MNDTELYIIMAEHFKLDGGAFFGVVPKALWSKYAQTDDNNMLPVCCRCLLVRDGQRLILIDDGIGNKQEGKFVEHLYLFGNDTLDGSLSVHGIKPEDITDVIQTHLHYDHCGGGVKYNEDRSGFDLTFPNADYWCSKAQWEWAVNPNPREGASYFKENIFPVMDSGKLKFIEKELKFSGNIYLKIFNGHTDGQVIPHIRHKGRTIVFMADFIPMLYHIPLPYIPSFDTRPLDTMKEKEEFLETAVDNDYILFFEHDCLNETCTLARTDKGIRHASKGSLSEILSR